MSQVLASDPWLAVYLPVLLHSRLLLQRSHADQEHANPFCPLPHLILTQNRMGQPFQCALPGGVGVALVKLQEAQMLF